jgi:hypothetical protein
MNSQEMTQQLESLKCYFSEAEHFQFRLEIAKIEAMEEQNKQLKRIADAMNKEEQNK